VTLLVYIQVLYERLYKRVTSVYTSVYNGVYKCVQACTEMLDPARSSAERTLHACELYKRACELYVSCTSTVRYEHSYDP
jgi:hypothetical protein